MTYFTIAIHCLWLHSAGVRMGDCRNLKPMQVSALRALAEGRTVAEIAKETGLSEMTIVLLLKNAIDVVGATTLFHAVVIFDRANRSSD